MSLPTEEESPYRILIILLASISTKYDKMAMNQAIFVAGLKFV